MSISRRDFLAATTASLAAPAISCGDEPAPPPKRIVLLAGPSSHGYGEHDHPAGCRLMADRLNRLGNVEARVLVGWPESEPIPQDIDALIVYGDGDDQNPLNGHFDDLQSLALAGVGVGIIHYALIVDGDRPRRLLLDCIGGYYEPNWSVNPMWTARIEELPKHPITRGVEPFVLEDEWYYHLRFRPEMAGITPLLTALPPADSLNRPDGPHSGNPHVRRAVLEDKQPQHLAWCVQRDDGGRGFGFTGLHWHWNWAHDGFRAFLLNAACWLAKAPVPDAGVPSPRPTLEELIHLAGTPPEGWKRQTAQERLDSWGQR